MFKFLSGFPKWANFCSTLFSTAYFVTFSLAQLFIVISCGRSGGLVPPGVVLVPVDDVLDELDGDEVEDESVGEHQLVG